MDKKIAKKIILSVIILSFLVMDNVYPLSIEAITGLRVPLASRPKKTVEEPIGSPVLVLNCGSSSVKYQVIDMETGKPIKIEGQEETIINLTARIDAKRTDEPGYMEGVYEEVINDILNKLPMTPIAIGHRVVHGGDKFSESVLIDARVIKQIEACKPLAPLHNPYNLLGITACRNHPLLKDVPNVAVFDTSFHQTLPERAYTYAIPRELSEQYSIRRYGFHGSSHRYVAAEADRMLRRDGRLKKNIKGPSRIITIHLGNGCSIAAVKGGKSIETSMGFTPLEGLVMGTRSGDIDPDIIFYLHRRTGKSIEEISNLLNKESGLLGLSGISKDMRDLIRAEEEGNERAKLAIEIFIYRICKYTYGYAGILGGVDAIVLTGGIGTGKDKATATGKINKINRRIKNRLNRYFENNYKEEVQPSILTIETNEQLVIARDTFNIYKNLRFTAVTEVSFPENPNRQKQNAVFAAIEAITGGLEPTNIDDTHPETPEIQEIIDRLARGYISIAEGYRKDTGKEPVIAELSYNTYSPAAPGDRSNVNVYIIDKAIEKAKGLRPSIIFYGAGSVQFDTAFVLEIAKKKITAEEGKADEIFLKEEPDIFVFPSFYSYEMALGLVKGYRKISKKVVKQELKLNRYDLLERRYEPESPVLKLLWQKARVPETGHLPLIFLPESENPAILEAGLIAHLQGLARIAMVTKNGEAPETLKGYFEKYSEELKDFVIVKGVAITPSTEWNRKNLSVYKNLFSESNADGIVMGIDTDTANVVQLCNILGEKEKKLGDERIFGIYDYFLMLAPDNSLISLVNGGSQPMPSAHDIAKMAVMAAEDMKSITGKEAKIALLRGTKRIPVKMAKALKIIQEMYPEIKYISCCSIERAIESDCNVLVPPDLFVGNICYKLAQRALNYEAWGPFILVGGPKKFSDLSRGASWEDILNIIAVVSARVSGQIKSEEYDLGIINEKSRLVEAGV